MSFNTFNFESSLSDGLDAMGFQTPTPVQSLAIPVILQNKDIIACAQTGTGKTAAFVLPILNKLAKHPVEHTNTLIIVPTRELAIQIDQAIQGFSYFTNASSIAIYGGGDGKIFDQEKKALTQGANIIIATPGRLISHLNLGYVKLKDLKHFVLDEADRMLDMGFVDDILKIKKFLPEKIQTIMFSATMAPKIRQLAAKLLHEPEQINIAIAKPAEGIKQEAYVVYDTQKNQLISSILEGNEEKYKSVIIFCSKKQTVKDLERDLKRVGLKVKAIHSDLDQKEREDVLISFKNRELQVLVATDILSRGIDIDEIGLVMNYDVPSETADYIHRIGRTARASSTGVAITFVNEKDQRLFSNIEKLIEKEIEKMPIPEHLGAGPEYNPISFKPKKKKKYFKKKKGDNNTNKQ